MSKGRVLLTFHVECPKTKPGDAVFVVGSAPELGAWKPEKAVPCTTTAKDFPCWTSETVVLEPDTRKVEFKVMMQKGDGSRPDQATWEGGANRQMDVKSAAETTQVIADCTWGHPEVTYRTKVAGGATIGGGQGLRPPEAVAASSPSVPSPTEKNFPRVDTGVNFVAEVDEGGDAVGALQDLHMHSLTRMHSRASKSSNRLIIPGVDGIQRRSSRHLLFHGDGHLNTEMSRVPSMMMINLNDLSEESKAHEEELAVLERDRLNQMQRRMPSGSLLENMKSLILKADPSKTVMLQGFNWESWRSGGGNWYSVVGQKLELFSGMGITDIWLPPPSASVAPQGYLPTQLFNLDGSSYGNQAALEALIRKMHDLGIRAVADIVVNHRCGDKQDNQGRWNQFTTGMVSRPSFAGVMDWGGWAITLGDKFSDGTGENHPGQYDGKFDAAPDIDHGNEKVQQSISIWLRWLQLQVGFDAWRFDFVKGYGAQYVGKYCQKSAPAWAVGELWVDAQYDEQGLCYDQDKNRQDLVNWVNATDKQCTAFDFTTKAVLQEAVRNCQYWRLKDKSGKPPGLIGWMPKHAVTFVDNHDTGSTQRHWPFPDDKVMVGYAYILTHPGIPSIFWDHVTDWGEHMRSQITELLKARRESGISVDAPVKICAAEHDQYIAEIGKPPALRVALGPRHCGDPDRNYWSNGPSGNQYRVWVHREQPKEPPPKKAPATAAPATVAPPLIVVKPPAPEPERAVQMKPKATLIPPVQTVPIEAPQIQEEAPCVDEQHPDLKFAPITVDGAQVTLEKLKAMGPPELQKFISRLKPVLTAAETVQAARGGGFAVPGLTDA